jgi:Tol biopolymer transport system component
MLFRWAVIIVACGLTLPALGARVVYLAEEDRAGVLDLYLVDLDQPGESIRLNRHAGCLNGSVNTFTVSPDGTSIVYSARRDDCSDFDIHLVRIAALDNRTRLGDLAAGTDEVYPKFSPDGRRLAFTATSDNFNGRHLFVVDLADPGTAIRMNGDLGPNGRVSLTGFQFTPDNSHLLYQAYANGSFGLFAVPLDQPGQPVKLNTPGQSVGDPFVPRFRILADSRRVVYAASTMNVVEESLNVVSLDAPGESIVLTPPQLNGGYRLEFDVSDDSRHVAFIAYRAGSFAPEAWLVSLEVPGVARKLNSDEQDSVAFPRFTRDSRYVVFVADGARGTDARDLYMVPVDGGSAAIRLSAPLEGSASINHFVLSHDGLQVAYPVYSGTGVAEELWAARLDSPESAMRINGSLSGGALHFNQGWQFSPDGTQVAFMAVADTDAPVYQLYFSSTASPGTTTQLNGELPTGGLVSPGSNAFLPASAPPTNQQSAGRPGTQGSESGGGSLGGFALLLLILALCMRRQHVS